MPTMPFQRDGREYCFHIYWPDAELVDPQPVKEGWEEVVSTACLDLTGFDKASVVLSWLPGGKKIDLTSPEGFNG